MALGDFEEIEILPFYTVLRNQQLCMSEYEQACNKQQKEAIKKAMSCQISLIWGPPGTGKSHAGVQIAFWFAIINRLEQSSARDSSSPDSDKDEPKTQVPPSQETEDEEGFKPVIKKHKKKSSKRLSKSKKATPYSKHDNYFFHLEVVNLQDDSVIPLDERHRQVLYCGPSNTCVNTVAGKLPEILIISYRYMHSKLVQSENRHWWVMYRDCVKARYL